MESERVKKIKKSMLQLEAALRYYEAAQPNAELAFLTLAKAFEVLVEYVWKELKARVEDEGLFANSPKDAVRQAATLGIIDQPEEWITCITARNDSVHDYFTIPQAEYAKIAAEFLKMARVSFKV